MMTVHAKREVGPHQDVKTSGVELTGVYSNRSLTPALEALLQAVGAA